jgi:hypothetical protein
VLKTLFWIAASNFVFPVMLSLTQLIFAFRDPSYLDSSYIMVNNIYVAIIVVLAATIWSSGFQWYSHKEERSDQSHSIPLSTLRAAPNLIPVSINVSTITSSHSQADRPSMKISKTDVEDSKELK